MHDVNETEVTIPHRDYFAVDGSYSFDTDWLHGLTLRAGIENLTDEMPPLVPSRALANTDPSQYDVLGRRYFVSLSMKF